MKREAIFGKKALSYAGKRERGSFLLDIGIFTLNLDGIFIVSITPEWGPGISKYIERHFIRINKWHHLSFKMNACLRFCHRKNLCNRYAKIAR